MPLGEEIVSCSRDKTVKIWNVDTGLNKRTLLGHDDWVKAVDVNADGSLIVTGGADKTVRVWSTDSGQCIAEFTDNTHVVTSVCFAPPAAAAMICGSEGAEVVASGSRDRSVRVFDVRGASQLCVLEGHDSWVNHVSFHPNSPRPLLLSSSDDKSVRIWDPVTKATIRQLVAAHDQFVGCVAVHSTGAWAVTGGADANIRIWDCN